MKKTLLTLTLGAALAASGTDYVFDPVRWTVQNGSKDGVKASVSPTGGLLIS